MVVRWTEPGQLPACGKNRQSSYFMQGYIKQNKKGIGDICVYWQSIEFFQNICNCLPLSPNDGLIYIMNRLRLLYYRYTVKSWYLWLYTLLFILFNITSITLKTEQNLLFKIINSVHIYYHNVMPMWYLNNLYISF